MSESFSPDGNQWAPSTSPTPGAAGAQVESEYAWAQPGAVLPERDVAPPAPSVSTMQGFAAHDQQAWAAPVSQPTGERPAASAQGQTPPVAPQNSMGAQGNAAAPQRQGVLGAQQPQQRSASAQSPQGYPPTSQQSQQEPVSQNPQQPQQPQQRQSAPSATTPSATRSRGTRVGMSQSLAEEDLNLTAALQYMIAAKASDLHLTTRSVPMIRVDGKLRPVDGIRVLEGDGLRRSIYQVLTQKQREKFEEDLELDFAYQVPGLARFRVNIYQQRDTIGAAFRAIPAEIRPLEELGIPAVVGSFANLPRGLVLVTGATGSGKSTTLASVVDMANRTRTDHIMTVEDPIEFLHEHKKSLVNQREVGVDTKSFANALKHVLRQDPDVILVGEMRDLETISVALTAAETGHLVFATLHTQDAAQTIDRVIDVFPPSQQAQVRVQLASAIQGVVCQTLCKRADGPGRVVATEVLVATPAIRNLIREGKTHQIYSAMQAGKQQGMQSMDQHLADLVRQGRISYESGLESCHHVEDFNRLAGRAGGATGSGFASAGMGPDSMGGL